LVRVLHLCLLFDPLHILFLQIDPIVKSLILELLVRDLLVLVPTDVCLVEAVEYLNRLCGCIGYVCDILRFKRLRYLTLNAPNYALEVRSSELCQVALEED
jgi:hypothetical protein